MMYIQQHLHAAESSAFLAKHIQYLRLRVLLIRHLFNSYI